MECIKCKAPLPEGAIFCPMCGKKQNEKKSNIHKRGNGQGTAIRRGKTWTAIWTENIYIDAETKGIKQVRKWKGGFTSKTAALAYAATPSEDPAKIPTLLDYWNGWVNGGFTKLSDSKKCAQKIAWKKLSSIAGMPVDKITIDTLQECIDEKAKTYYPAKDMKTVLSHLLKRAIAEGYIGTNLSEFITLPKLKETEANPFTEKELAAFWEAYGNGDRIIGFVLLMIYTGMMPGEIFILKSDMIDWEKREIVKAGIKTAKRKEIPIVFPEMIAPVLDNLVQSSSSAAGYVLGMNKDKFYKEYHESIKKAGARDLPPYSCRHTTATALALGNIAPSVIQNVMRHSKFSTTQRYIHPDNKSAHDAINTIGKGV